MAKTKQALVARIDEQGRDVVRTHLEKHGYEVFCAANGADALSRAREVTPDLLFVDGVLPKFSGFELCREVRGLANPKRVITAMVLEDGDSYGRGRARAEGVDLILNEPLLEDDFSDLGSIEEHPHDHVDDVLTGRTVRRDRFLKDLLKVGSSKSDPMVQKISDPLTGLHHKEFMTLKLEEEFKKACRYGYPLAILLVDVENHDEALANHGRPIAQELLLEAAGIFLCESRDVDCAGRVDEARFLLLLPNTGLDGARLMADRVFQQVCTRKVRAGDVEVPLRASVGIAALPSADVTSVDDFVERALRAMRTASNLGGNRICAWGDPVVESEQA